MVSDPGAPELVAALVRLARKGAYALAGEGAGEPLGPFAVYSPRNGFAKPIGMLQRHVVQAALGAGLVQAVDTEPAGLRIDLSARGRTAVRRALLQQSGTPAPREKASAGARVARCAPVPVQRVEGPLAWLRRRKDKDGRPLVSQPQFDAGERLAADFHRAQMLPRVTASWSPVAARSRRPGTAGAIEIGEGALAARERLHRALRAIGPELGPLVLDVCCRDLGLEAAERARGWPKRSGRIVLDMGLTALARHYGLLRQLPVERVDVRGWAEPGFQPDLSAWTGDDG